MTLKKIDCFDSALLVAEFFKFSADDNYYTASLFVSAHCAKIKTATVFMLFLTAAAHTALRLICYVFHFACRDIKKRLFVSVLA